MEDFRAVAEVLIAWNFPEHGGCLVVNLEVDFPRWLIGRLGQFFVSDALEKGLFDIDRSELPAAAASFTDDDLLTGPRGCASERLQIVCILVFETTKGHTHADDADLLGGIRGAFDPLPLCHEADIQDVSCPLAWLSDEALVSDPDFELIKYSSRNFLCELDPLLRSEIVRITVDDRLFLMSAR